MGRTNKVEMEKRYAIVERLLVEGKKSTEIVHVISERYGISQRMAWKYIKKAWGRIKESYDKDRERWLGFHVQARLRLYEKAFKSDKLYTSMQILRDLAELEGLYVNKVAFTDPEGKKEFTQNFSDAEIKRRVLAVLGINENEFNEIVETVRKKKGVSK